LRLFDFIGLASLTKRSGFRAQHSFNWEHLVKKVCVSPIALLRR
jgi:hypothetical protein